MSHFFRNFDAEKIETALQNPPAKIAQCEPLTADWVFRLQNGTRFVERVKAVRQLEQIICQNVRAKTVQHLRDDFRELAETFCEIDFAAIGENQLVDFRRGFASFAKNRANSHIRVLQIRRGVSLKVKHPVPGT